ncbi:MAG: hypothetical protein ACRDJP_07200, partial [Actinomycetota bacterium]
SFGQCAEACNVIAGNGTGVYVASGTALSPNSVRGNFIGVESGGTAEPNMFAGVTVDGGSGTVIGGVMDTQRNVISGNGNGGGVFIQPSEDVSGTQIIGNYIGLSPDGQTARPNGADGIRLNGVNVDNLDDTTIQDNLISGNAGAGVHMTDVAVQDVTIQGNHIGVTADGSTGLGNGGDGVSADVDITGPVTVGGATASVGNVISGNTGYGLNLRGTATYAVSGNWVGTNGAGGGAVPNAGGGMSVGGTDSLVGGDNATPGGTCSGACNLVSGNIGVGITVTDTTEVQGNYVGTNLAGTAAVPNTSHGVCECSTDSGVAVIGGTTAAQRNVIAGNDGSGVAFINGALNNEVHGNSIGIGADGLPLGNEAAGVRVAAASGNQIGGQGNEANEIAHNGGPGMMV